MSLLKVAGTTASSGTLYVDDVFSTWLYTGNGSTQTITNGIDLAGKGGLVWFKNRSTGTAGSPPYTNSDHGLYDTVRGAAKYLSSNGPDAQIDFGTGGGLQSFTSTGFSVKDNSFGGWGINGSLYQNTSPILNYASWTFRKAAKFFDVVTWTGDGVTNGGTNPLNGATYARSITHSLGIAPGMIIVKCTSAGSTNWKVYVETATHNVLLALNSTEASQGTASLSGGYASAYNPSPENTFYLYNYYSGGVAEVNASGATYVAYLFAHDTDADGIIQCGSFTTDGSGNATVNLGWEPQYLMYKAATSTSSWLILDTMRGFSETNDKSLAAESSAAEFTTMTGRIPKATGFTISLESSSTTYIYMAIRMPNKPPTSGTQVFSPVARTGTGATATVSLTNLPDLLIGANRASAYPFTYDRLRGVNRLNQALGTYSSDSEAGIGAPANTVTALNNVSYVVGTDGSGFSVNNAGVSLVSWNFTRAPGFFDEVCWTRTTTVATLNHNLTVVPQLIIKKDRSKAGTYWDTMINVSPYDYRYDIYLNDTQAISGPSGGIYWNAAPTATTFDVNMAGDGSSNGDTFVAYLFATLAGISKVGSYTGNGTGQAIACGFSAGARFVLIKRTDSTGNWYTFDSARGLTVGSSPYLLLNSTAAETTGDNGVYASTGGFTLGATAITTTNIATATYIFLAVA